MIRPDRRMKVALTAILLVLPNAFWKADSAPRQATVRIVMRPSGPNRHAASAEDSGFATSRDRSPAGSPRAHRRR